MSIIFIILLSVCFATSFAIVYQSWKTFVNERDESHTIVLGCSVFYSLIYLYGIIIRIYHLFVPAVAGTDSIEARMIRIGCSLEMFHAGMVVAMLFMAVFNLLLAWIVKRNKWVIVLQLVAIVSVMCLGSVLAVVVTRSNPVANFFLLCCGIMSAFAWVLDLTYKEFCVLGNIYLQITLCLVASIAPLCSVAKSIMKQGTNVQRMLLCVVCIVNLFVHTLLFMIVCIHYWMPLDDGYDLCYKELNECAAATGLSYEVVNLVIFVILFLADLAFNALLYFVSRKMCKEDDMKVAY